MWTGLKKKKKNDTPTSAIANAGLRAFVFQTNFSKGGYERAPKTQTFHIPIRCESL